MINGTKIPKSGLILAGLAAFAYYKYSKMSEEQKRNFVNDLKEKGKKYYDQYVPEEIKSILAKNGQMNTSNNFSEENITM